MPVTGWRWRWLATPSRAGRRWSSRSGTTATSGPIPEVYRYKARVYCLQHDLEWRPHTERELTEEEIAELEGPRPGQINTWREEYWMKHGRLPSEGWEDPLDGMLDEPDDGTYRPPSWAARNPDGTPRDPDDDGNDDNDN